MYLPKNRWITLYILCFLLGFPLSAQEPLEDDHLEVSLRMIGHQVLLQSKDSTSRVLPIVKKDNRYEISFASDFEFVPEDLVAITDSIVKATYIASRYILEVQECDSDLVVYSFEVNELTQKDIVPCQSRVQPKACYTIYFTMMDSGAEISEEKQTTQQDEPSSKWYLYVMVIGFILAMGSALFIVFKNRKPTKENPNIINLGAYKFDKLNTELIIEERRIELTSKEADLLLLLYESNNSTVERETILNRVWGDEGDYVGRTLDVFISKLRKKLEFDSGVKIVNVRGVGYKLVLNN